ncbi:MAG: NAD(P)/FAD-dependent oxidoreductase [Limnohabitans sp.]|jgi:thioredoxin reductase (NADPH)|nr:MAG: NAD(P)/FAD-dependent oxidoreductase [Limnohabitans sp.]
MATPIDTDALVIGAGPVGLFQAFQLGLQGIACHIVDALPHVGGQCAELYADKPIYDIPGIPVCTGLELVERLQQQIAPFKPTFHLGQTVETLEAEADGRWLVATDRGSVWLTKTIFIAAGVGAFVPRSLPIEGIASHLGRQVWFGSQPLPDIKGQHLLVTGDGDSALQTALDAQATAVSVTLMHRREQFSAKPERIEALRAAQAAGRVRFVAGQPTALVTEGERLIGLQYLNAEGQEVPLPCDQLVMALGLSPKLGPVAQWGLQIERKQLVVNTETFATSAPGIFAVGDINTYPGKKKLILCGFHEATLAAFGAAAHLWPNDKTLLQYTTTSTTLHQRLGLI